MLGCVSSAFVLLQLRLALPQNHSGTNHWGLSPTPASTTSLLVSTEEEQPVVETAMPSCLDGTAPFPQPQTFEEFERIVRRWWAKDAENFRTDYVKAVRNVQDPPPNTNRTVLEDWKKKTDIDDLVGFFQSWYGWKPEVETGLEQIQKFSWLYYKNDAGLKFVTEGLGRLMTEYFVVLNGMWYDTPSDKSTELIDAWIAKLGPKIMKQYKKPDIGLYSTFNEFFTRELKDNMRPISSPDDDAVAVSPADAIINMIDDRVNIDRPLDVKTQKITPRKLLNDSPLAEYFTDGTALSCILMPDVYHRYHSPVKGEVVESEQDVAGNYFGIEDFPNLLNGGNVGYGYDYSVFEHFRRGYLIIKTEKYGYVAVVPVGLNTISSVVFDEKFKRITDKDRPEPIDKGQEIGYFQYGGSLNILLFQNGVFPAVRIPQGQIIGTLGEPKKPGQDDEKIQFIF